MPPFDAFTVVNTLAVPFADGATAGLFIRLVEFSVLRCTVGATAYQKKTVEKKFNLKFTIKIYKKILYQEKMMTNL